MVAVTLLAGALAVLCSICALLMILVKRFRALGRKLLWSSLIAGAISSAVAGHLIKSERESKAKDLGFSSSSEYVHAEQYQITSAAEWEKRKPAIIKQEEQEKARLATVEAAESRKRKEAAAVAKRSELEIEMNAKFVSPDKATWRQHVFIDSAKEAVRERLSDPGSASFRGLYFHSPKNGLMVVCGEVNAKNKFGGYSGFERFMSNSTPAATFLESDVKAVDFPESWKALCQ